VKKTVKEEYGRLIKENQELLNLIWKEMLKQMPKKSPDWADVGDVNHSHETLVELLVRIRNTDDEDEMKKQIEIEISK
jgi:hypothetical protein